ncbi:ribosomal protection-like ABC-F family protein [Shouchella xiaoxiensis]|uniref:ribosomal protection-like ABC-F family protein n=1 Tax=Shouchella xiaoxiensis TaxID=766895 RepID=UPI001958A871
MIELIRIHNGAIEFDGNCLFEKITVSIQQNTRIGIIGKNGAGKSTLLQLLTGERALTSGHVEHLNDSLSIAVVTQEEEHVSFEIISPEEQTLRTKWNIPSRSYEQLSGGEKLKARLARGFAQEADLLLLDEPTNHLDEASVAMVVEAIQTYQGTVVFISHDRYFLDQTASHIWAFEQHTLYEHKGNYSSYREDLAQRRLAQQRAYDKQQAMVGRIEGQLNQLGAWSAKGHKQSTKQEGFKEYHRKKAGKLDAQVKSKRKRLEKELERINASPVEEPYEVQFSFATQAKVGKRFLEVKNLAKSYGEQTLFKKSNFTIQHGEKVALVGPNGSGKTTFLKLINGDAMPTKGTVWISPSAKIGYLTQDVFDLPLEQTPEDLFYQETFAKKALVLNLMKHLGFSVAQWKEPIKQMSMGERVKCKLMYDILAEKDVLILDEPTNHLDLESREQLEATLSEYSGTLLVVSHDRYFLEKTTNVTLQFDQNSLKKVVSRGEAISAPNKQAEQKLALETKRQEVLGKLSFLTPADPDYKSLDAAFTDLTKQIRELD